MVLLVTSVIPARCGFNRQNHQWTQMNTNTINFLRLSWHLRVSPWSLRLAVKSYCLRFSACLGLFVCSFASVKICVHLCPSVVFLFPFALVAAPRRWVHSWLNLHAYSSDEHHRIAQPTNAADLNLNPIPRLQAKGFRRNDACARQQNDAKRKPLAAEQKRSQLLEAAFDLAH